MEDKRIPIRGNKEILKLAQRSRKVTQAEIAGMIGVKQSAMSGQMNRPRMSLGMFAKILDVLDYDIVIVNRETGEADWKLYVERSGECDDDI